MSRLASFSVEEKARYHATLRQLVPQISGWKIELSRGQLFVEYTTIAGARHSADLLGDGIASLFRIALAIHDARLEAQRTSQTIIIDEPELSLHPQAQKRLANYLTQITSDRQVVITTHSPYFVNWADMLAGAQVYRLALNAAGIQARHLADTTVRSISGLYEDWQKPNLLDPVAREVFFADAVVYFEGQEDVGLLRKFARDKSLVPLEVFGYGVGGSGNIKYFLQMAQELGVRAAAIYDGDKSSEMLEAKKLFPDAMIEKLAASDIRDKMKRDQNNKETDVVEKKGLFSKNGTIKSEHEEYLVDLINRVHSFLNR